MAVDLREKWIEDIRMPILGDSYGWYQLEPTPAKNWLVIHHSAGPVTQDGYDIAAYHVNNNGWGGIGYHFVIRHDNHPKGAGVEYVGDLATMRAHVENANNGKVGICLVGNFLNEKPGRRQLELARLLIEFLMAPNGILPSINYFSQVTFHGQIPGQSTACPGYNAPWFGDWANYLKGGAFPNHWYAAPAPTPAPQPEPTPVPVVVTPEPAPPVDTRPEWERTWTPEALSDKVVAVASADVWDVANNTVVKRLPGGELVQKLAGYFAVNNQLYVRTQWSVDKGKWNGILISELKDWEAPVVTPPSNPGGVIDGVQPPPSIPDSRYDTPSETPVEPETEPTEAPKRMSIGEAIKVLLEAILGVLLTPLRLGGTLNRLFNKETK